jgi:CO/xanthine dehydrogenase FAD-binding subunit
VVPALDFVTGDHQNILQAGELLRSIHLPATALARRYALRRASLVKLGRSAALLIGTRGSDGALLITITASTPRPIQLAFAEIPTADELRCAIASAIPDDDYFDDVNGLPEYRRHLTYYFAEQIRVELAQSGSKA